MLKKAKIGECIAIVDLDKVDDDHFFQIENYPHAPIDVWVVVKVNIPEGLKKHV